MWAFSSCGKWELLSSCPVQAPHCGGFTSCRAPALEHAISTVAPGLSYSAACGIFPDQGSNWYPLHGRFVTIAPPRKPSFIFSLIFKTVFWGLSSNSFLWFCFMLGKFGNDYCKARGALKTATPVIELKQVSPGKGFLPAIARGVQGSPSKCKAYWTCCEELLLSTYAFLLSRVMAAAGEPSRKVSS